METRTSHRATPARNCRSRQAEHIPIGIGHDRQARIGHVIHLEMLGRHLWAVGQLNEPVPDDVPWRFSVETTSTYERNSLVGDDIEITGLGIVTRSAQMNLAPIRLLPGDLRSRGSWHLPKPEQTLVDNAADVLPDRRHHRPIQIRGLLDADQLEARYHAEATAEYYRQHPYDRRPPGPIEYSRHIGRILDVR